MSSTGGFLVINKEEREEQCKIKTTCSDINLEQKLLGNVEKDKFCDSVMSKGIVVTHAYTACRSKKTSFQAFFQCYKWPVAVACTMAQKL